MSRPDGPVAVIVALTDPSPTAGASLGRFVDEAGPLGEVVLVDASGADRVGLDPRIRLIRRPPGRLAPELWRDGLRATDAPLVALSTASMVPRPGWLAALVDRLESTGAAGVGGPIEPGRDLAATDRAVALLRYSAYLPPLPGRPTIEPPGDNALYRRGALMEVESSWRDGFWEVEVHRALRDRGETLAMAGPAVVTFEGGVTFPSMIRQRWEHARRFGAGRSEGSGPIARMARVAACPLVPPLMVGRILAALMGRGMALGPWLPALPGLAVLASSWALGEAVGTFRGLTEPGAGDRIEPGKGLPPAPLSLGERAGVRASAGRPAPRQIGNLVQGWRHDPHPGLLPEGEGARGPRRLRITAPITNPDRSPPEIVEDVQAGDRWNLLPGRVR